MIKRPDSNPTFLCTPHPRSLEAVWSLEDHRTASRPSEVMPTDPSQAVWGWRRAPACPLPGYWQRALEHPCLRKTHVHQVAGHFPCRNPRDWHLRGLLLSLLNSALMAKGLQETQSSPSTLNTHPAYGRNHRNNSRHLQSLPPTPA